MNLLDKNRLIVLEKSNYKCEKCGGSTKWVHHRDGKRINHGLENLQVLCPQCHVNLHYEMGTIKHHKYNNQYTNPQKTHMQVTINTRISPELATWLDKYSKEAKIAKAQIIAAALEDYKKKVSNKA